MTLPLPNRTLGSSICDVVTWLPNEDQISVLLYAMECLPVDIKYVDHISAQDSSYHLISSSREVIENAVKSFFQAPFGSQDCRKTIRAHLLRAKSRIAGELHDAARQGLIFLSKVCGLTCRNPDSSDVQAILLLDPDHCEAGQLLILIDRINGKDPMGTGNVSLDWLH